MIRDSALQQIDLKNDVCDGRQRSRSTDAAACVQAQMSLIKRYLELSTCQVLSRKVVRKKDCVQLVLRTFCAHLSESKKNRPLRSGGDVSWGLTFSRIGETGFEPAASCSQSKRATKLRHSPAQTEISCQRAAVQPG